MNLAGSNSRERDDDNRHHDGYQQRLGQDAEPSLYGRRNDNDDTEHRRFGESGRYDSDDHRRQQRFGGNDYDQQEYGHGAGRDEGEACSFQHY